jgi:hypothetical protein
VHSWFTKIYFNETCHQFHILWTDMRKVLIFPRAEMLILKISARLFDPRQSKRKEMITINVYLATFLHVLPLNCTF